MSLTIDIIDTYVTGDRKTVIADVTFDASYPTGGEPITASDLQATGSIRHLAPGLAWNASGALAVGVIWDAAHGKLIAVKGAAGNLPEVTSTNSLAAYVSRIVATVR